MHVARVMLTTDWFNERLEQRMNPEEQEPLVLIVMWSDAEEPDAEGVAEALQSGTGVGGCPTNKTGCGA